MDRITWSFWFGWYHMIDYLYEFNRYYLNIEIGYELLKKSKRGRKDRGMKSPPPKPRQPQASEGHISYHGFVRVMKLFMKMPRGKLLLDDFLALYKCNTVMIMRPTWELNWGWAAITEDITRTSGDSFKSLPSLICHSFIKTQLFWRLGIVF